MRRLIDRCAGIDMGQALLVVCVRLVDKSGDLYEEVRSFGATTPDLLELRDYLLEDDFERATPICHPALRPGRHPPPHRSR
jgi:hypothetical protein